MDRIQEEGLPLQPCLPILARTGAQGVKTSVRLSVWDIPQRNIENES